MKRNENRRIPGEPERLSTYFYMEWWPLLVVTVSGIFYNIGLLAGPWFEGKLAQCLYDVFEGRSGLSQMVRLAFVYVAVIGFVQGMRYVKRLYVRKFANNVNRSMKETLYGNLVHKSKVELESENAGSIMTKAISDVDACVEGMRKFTTEVFDTGVALLGYMALLVVYDWRLGLLSLCFPPISFALAERMKTAVQKSGAIQKECAGRLNAATLDRAGGAVMYRVFGCEEERDKAYESVLSEYEKAAVRANIRVAAMPPLYQIISMASTVFILYFGAKNVLHTGWAAWDIAAFTTFLSCYAKLSDKSSKAAKLFNAVQKAEVSWKRIKPLMKRTPDEASARNAEAEKLVVEKLGCAYSGGDPVFEGLSFTAEPGQVIGVTGPVACGKSTFGKAFLGEFPYEGSIRFGGREVGGLTDLERSSVLGYLGHDAELLSGTIRQNVLLGKEDDAEPYLKAVCLEKEISDMPETVDTLIGNGGVRLSGGQQARLALARTLAHKRPLLILDDPFSALDRNTEEEVFRNVRELAADSIVIILSHRLYLFPQMDQVIWMDGGRVSVGNHETLLEENPQYAGLYRAQCEKDGFHSFTKGKAAGGDGHEA